MQSRGQIIGGSTVLLTEQGRRVLVPGMNDIVVIVQVKDCLEVIVNGRDKHVLTAAESRAFSVRGNTAKVFADRSVQIPIKGLSGAGAAPQASPSARERLAHARQRSGALSAVVARQRVVQELLKDPFLIGISELLIRLARYFDVQLQQPRAPNDPSDLNRMFSEAARGLEFQIACKPLPVPDVPPPETLKELAPETLEILLNGIVLSLNRLVADTGASDMKPDLNPLASQLMEALRRLVFEGPRPPSLPPGKRPAESKRPVPGIDPRTRMLLCSSWNHVLSEQDAIGLANLVQNDDALAVLSTDEKIALLGRILAMPAEEVSPLSLVNRVLQSAADADSFHAMLSSCLPGIRRLAASGADAATFSIAAAAFGSAAHATDPQAAERAAAAIGAGFTAGEILAARSEVSAVRMQAEDLERLVQDPLRLALATTTEKLEMLQVLLKGAASSRYARALVAVLLASEDRAEFDAFAAGVSREAGQKVKDPEARRTWDLLAGGMGRADLAMDRTVASFTENCLLQPDTIRSMRQDWARLADKELPREEPASGKPGDAFKSFLQNAVSLARDRLHARVTSLDRRAAVNAALIAADHRKTGKELFNPVLLRRQAHQILFRQIAEKEKKKQLGDLGKTVGAFTVRNMVVPLAFLYKMELHNLEKFGESVLGPLVDQMSRQGLRYGSDSAGVQEIQMVIDRAAAVLDPITYTLSRNIAVLEALYPPPREWYESE